MNVDCNDPDDRILFLDKKSIRKNDKILGRRYLLKHYFIPNMSAKPEISAYSKALSEVLRIRKTPPFTYPGEASLLITKLKNAKAGELIMVVGSIPRGSAGSILF